MSHEPVLWSEGMFLRPQHFQAADRFWTETLQTSEQWDHPYNYGLYSIEISPESISNYQVQITSCSARMRDGTQIRRSAGQEFDRIDLKKAFETQDSVTLYLAVPLVRMGRMNIGNANGSGQHRWVEVQQAFADEAAGGNEQEVGLRAVNVQLLLSTDDLSGFEKLPVCRIQRAGDKEATPRIDTSYFPPVLTVDAWEALGKGEVRSVYDKIGQKLEMVSEQVVNRGISLAAQEPGDLERVFMLRVLNEAYATVGCLTLAAGIHPFTVYTELCRVVGMLAIFSKERRLQQLPRYDHDDLARVFKWMHVEIDRLLGGVREYEFEQRAFIGAGQGMQVSLEAKWLNPTWDWFVGVKPSNITPNECRELLSVGNLDWKMGSSAQVDMLFRLRAEGVHIVPLQQEPRALPAHGGWIYYEVSRDNAAWKDVLATQTLAMRFKVELISNLQELEGRRRLVVSFRGKQAILEFALFAVQRQV